MRKHSNNSGQYNDCMKNKKLDRNAEGHWLHGEQSVILPNIRFLLVKVQPLYPYDQYFLPMLSVPRSHLPWPCTTSSLMLSPLLGMTSLFEDQTPSQKSKAKSTSFGKADILLFYKHTPYSATINIVF